MGGLCMSEHHDGPARVVIYRQRNPEREYGLLFDEEGEHHENVEVLASVPIRGETGYARWVFAPFYGDDASARAVEKAREIAEELGAPEHPRTVASLQREDDGRLMTTPEYLGFLRGQLEDPATISVTPSAALQLLDELELVREALEPFRGEPYVDHTEEEDFTVVPTDYLRALRDAARPVSEGEGA